MRWSSGLNGQLWQQVLRLDRSSAFNPNYTTPDRKQVYGALSDNPSNEVRYAEINSNSADGDVSKSRFFATQPVRNITNSAGAGAIVGREFAWAAPVLMQKQDMADLVLMDFIFQQQDRFGNIHAKFYWYWLNDSGALQRRRIRLGAGDQPNLSDKPNPNAVVVKRLLLKDNDCGSRAGNPKAFTS